LQSNGFRQAAINAQGWILRTYDTHNNPRKGHTQERAHLFVGQTTLKLLSLLVLLQLLTARPLVALSPLDNGSGNVTINATLSNGDMASSESTFIMTQSQAVTLDGVHVYCGIANRGPVASFRIYLDLANDLIKVYFAFSQVYGGWRGVAQGWVDNFREGMVGAALDPQGASSTSVSVQLASGFGYQIPLSGGGFNVVVRVWAEGSPAVWLYAGECQFVVIFENAQNGGANTIAGGQSPIPSSTGDLLGLIVIIASLMSLTVIAALRMRTRRH
jgi:hypothetical protein